MAGFVIVATVGISACTGSSTPEAEKVEPAGPSVAVTGNPRPIRVIAAGRVGEYPSPAPADTTLHALDGDLSTRWAGGGVARFEFGASDLTSIALVPSTGGNADAWGRARKVTKIRWRPLPADGSTAPWQEVDLDVSTTTADNPWVSVPVPRGSPVFGVELEPIAATPEGPDPMTIAEVRFVGRSQDVDRAARSNAWTAMVGVDPSGPFTRPLGAWEAVDPARCAGWSGGEEKRGVESCRIDRRENGAMTLHIGKPDVFDAAFDITPVGGCFGLIDGMPFTRCRMPGAGPVSDVPIPPYAAKEGVPTEAP